jgi:hypothetical protein
MQVRLKTTGFVQALIRLTLPSSGPVPFGVSAGTISIPGGHPSALYRLPNVPDLSIGHQMRGSNASKIAIVTEMRCNRSISGRVLAVGQCVCHPVSKPVLISTVPKTVARAFPDPTLAQTGIDRWVRDRTILVYLHPEAFFKSARVSALHATESAVPSRGLGKRKTKRLSTTAADHSNRRAIRACFRAVARRCRPVCLNLKGELASSTGQTYTPDTIVGHRSSLLRCHAPDLLKQDAGALSHQNYTPYQIARAA